MAKNNDIGLTIGLDTTSLSAALQNVKRTLDEANSEFKAATSGMDDWKKSTEGLNAKIKQLRTGLKAQEDVLDGLEKAYANMTEEEKQTSEEARTLRIAINNQKAAIGKAKKDIDKFDKALEDVDKSQEEVEDSTKKTNKALDDQEKAAKNAGDGFTVLKGTVANLISSGISSLISGLSSGVQALLDTTEASQQYRTELAKLDTAAEANGYSTEYAKEKYSELNSVIGDSTAANTAVSNFMAMGLAEKDLDGVLNTAMGIWTRYGDSIPLDGLAESINETSKVGAVTGGLADALNWAGINEDKFNESLEACTTEQERQQLILDTLNKEYGESAEAYKENNKELIEANEATQKQADAQARLGEAMLPVNTAISNAKTELMNLIAENVDFEKVGERVKALLENFKDEILPKVIEYLKTFKEETLPKIKEFLVDFRDNIWPKIQEAFTWLKDNLPTIIGFVAGLGTALLALNVYKMIMNMVAAVKAWTIATQGMTIAQRLLNLAQKANLIGVIVTAIGLLIAAIVHLWNNNEEFRDAVIAIWEKIKEVFGKVVDWIVEEWDKMIQFFKDAWEAIKLVYSVVADWFSEMFTKAKDKIVSAFSSIKTFFSDIWKNIKNTFSNVGSWFSDKFKSAWTNIKKAFSSVGTFFGGIWDTIKSKFTDIGQKIGSSMSTVFKKAVNGLLATAETILNAPIKGINTAIGLLNKVPGVDIGTLSTFKLPRMELAEGGIVNRATAALIGEDGAEAVIPLERNLGWISKLAKQLTREMNGNNLINSNSMTNSINYTQIINAPKQPSLAELYRRTGNLLDLKGGAY